LHGELQPPLSIPCPAPPTSIFSRKSVVGKTELIELGCALGNSKEFVRALVDAMRGGAFTEHKGEKNKCFIEPHCAFDDLL
jgi:hypothetical protein